MGHQRRIVIVTHASKGTANKAWMYHALLMTSVCHTKYQSYSVFKCASGSLNQTVVLKTLILLLSYKGFDFLCDFYISLCMQRK